MLSACGEDGTRFSFARRAPAPDRQALQGVDGIRFDGSLVKKPFVPKSAIWGIEARGALQRKGLDAYRTHDLIVLLSSSDDACSDWPRSLAAQGHMGLVLRMSKLVRHAGSAVFVEPDEGTYHVEQPHGSAPVVNRGAELVFRAITTERGDIDAWIANHGHVEITERSSTSDEVRGTFVNEMVPFVLDAEPEGPVRAVSGAFVAQRCARMDDLY